MRYVLLFLGFTTTIGQVLLARELVAVFYGNELILGLILAAWLAWGALGAWIGGRMWAPGGAGGYAVPSGLVFLGWLPALQVLMARAVRVLMGAPPGALVEFGPTVVAILLLGAPTPFLAGALFPLFARRLAEEGHPPAAAYVWECVGAAVGGVLFRFLFVRYLDPIQVAAVLSLLGSLAISLPLRTAAGGLLRLPLRTIAGALARLFLWLSPLAAALAFLLAAPSFHRASLRWQWADLAFAADSPYGRLTIQARDSQRVFFVNGALAFESQSAAAEAVVHPPLLAHPAPRRVLLVGGSAAGNLREILRHPVEQVTCVELDPLLLQAARRYLPPADAAVLGDPRVQIVLTDGRAFIQTTWQTFDVVILDLPEPSTGALNRFYTLEFFAHVRRILNAGGILALKLPAAENYWSPELARRNGSVYHTLRAVFPFVFVLPGDVNYFLASLAPIQADPAAWTGRLRERGIVPRMMTPEYIHYLFTTDRFAQTQDELERTAGVRLNRDLEPICYYYDLALWLSRFYPRLRVIFERTDWVRLGWLIPLLAVPIALARVRRRWAVPLAVFAVGLAGMTLEVVLLLAYQILQGSLYGEISLLLAAYMVGMTVGSRWTASRRWRRTQVRWGMLFLLGGLALFAGGFPLLLQLPLPVPVVLFSLLTLLVGGLAGAAFPLAVRLVEGEAGQVVGSLYGADLAGGCLGALLGATVLIPLLGIPQTCVAIALVVLAGLAAIV